MTDEPTARSRVLLVEDEALIAMLMEDMLADHGCEVSVNAARLDEAIAAARSQSFDMAFIDLNLNGVPAYPVADVLRFRGIPFAFVTGYGAAAGDPAFPGVPVLQKPFRGHDLEQILHRLRPR
jgi:CheY-like chemotaxis protein